MPLTVAVYVAYLVLILYTLIAPAVAFTRHHDRRLWCVAIGAACTCLPQSVVVTHNAIVVGSQWPLLAWIGQAYVALGRPIVVAASAMLLMSIDRHPRFRRPWWDLAIAGGTAVALFYVQRVLSAQVERGPVVLALGTLRSSADAAVHAAGLVERAEHVLGAVDAAARPIYGAVYEELIFRGVLLDWIRRQVMRGPRAAVGRSHAIAIVLSLALWTLTHFSLGEAPPQGAAGYAFLIAVCGAVFTTVALSLGIECAILTHFAYDLMIATSNGEIG